MFYTFCFGGRFSFLSRFSLLCFVFVVWGLWDVFVSILVQKNEMLLLAGL